MQEISDTGICRRVARSCFNVMDRLLSVAVLHDLNRAITPMQHQTCLHSLFETFSMELQSQIQAPIQVWLFESNLMFVHSVAVLHAVLHSCAPAGGHTPAGQCSPRSRQERISQHWVKICRGYCMEVHVLRNLDSYDSAEMRGNSDHFHAQIRVLPCRYPPQSLQQRRSPGNTAHHTAATGFVRKPGPRCTHELSCTRQHHRQLTRGAFTSYAMSNSTLVQDCRG